MSTQGSRKAALALAAMHPRDRRWMMERLPSEWRKTLAPLVGEARSKLLDDPEVRAWALKDIDTANMPELPTPDVLVAALDRLGDGWAARVLALAAPDHVEVYLAACDKRREATIRQELKAMPKMPPGSLAAAMTRFLHQDVPVLRTGDGVR